MAVVVWALIGIAVAQSEHPLVSGASWAGAGLTAAGLLQTGLRVIRQPEA